MKLLHLASLLLAFLSFAAIAAPAAATTTMHRAYGWRPQLPDFRDHVLPTARFGVLAASLPAMVDLRPHDCPIKDQGQLGSCTANAIAGAVEYALIAKNQGAPMPAMSRLFIYYNERALEGTVHQDAGAVIRDGFKSINKQGVCPEAEWPYVESKFARKPGASCYVDAAHHLATGYQAVPQTLLDLKACLAAGRPFVFGFSVYESFESEAVAKSGHAPLPAKGEQLLGGHAVKCVGYDEGAGTFLCANSWGTDWGQAGYFTLPYAYLTNPKLASDFWTIQTES